MSVFFTWTSSNLWHWSLPLSSDRRPQSGISQNAPLCTLLWLVCGRHLPWWCRTGHLEGSVNRHLDGIKLSDIREIKQEGSISSFLRWTRSRPLTFRPSLNQTPSQSSLLSLHISSAASLTTASTSDKPQMKWTPGSEWENIWTWWVRWLVKTTLPRAGVITANICLWEVWRGSALFTLMVT